jgi:linearmycin/streptolysin S transport system permease protein
MAVFEIARVNLLRTLRDRSSLLFVFLLPFVLIVALGVAFGGGTTSRVGVVRADAGPLGDELVDDIRSGQLDVDLRERTSLDQLRDDVEAGRLELGLLIPPGYDADLRDGQDVELTLVARPERMFAALQRGIEAAVAGQSARLRAARVATETSDLSLDEALSLARQQQEDLAGIDVTTITIGESLFPSIDNPFALGAQSQTVLFMFLTSMTAATQLVITRQLGVARRMLATPTPVRSILLGELLGRFSVAMLQGAFIVLMSSLVFGVSWGSLPEATLVIVIFAFIGTGAAMAVGVFARTPDQASALSVVGGMLLAALGGAMVPAELFDEPMSTISRLTPHYWAIDAFRHLAFDKATLFDILLPLAILALYAVGLLAIGIWGLRRSLTRG